MHSAAIPNRARIAGVLLATLVLSYQLSSAETPTSETLRAFDAYVQAAEIRNNEELASRKNFLWLDILPPSQCERILDRLKHQQTVIQRSAPCDSRNCSNIPGGIIHHWTAITFVPGVTLLQTLAAIQDYDRDAEYYRSTVLRARLLSRTGNSFRVFLRLKETHVLTVVLDTDYEIQYLVIDPTHAASTSHSTRITEIENAGTAQERPISPEANHGFLWRLNSYWRFYQADGGVYIQCTAISLTRDVPASLRWLVAPFVENVPRESLNFTLTATREALLKNTRTKLANSGRKENIMKPIPNVVTFETQKPTHPAKTFCRPRKFENATRLQNSFTSAPERKALLWLVARIPPSINSDHLTLLGFAAMFFAGCSYAFARWNPWGLLLATICLALNWLGDSLDGTLARVRNRQRPRYGFYVDHIIDSFGALFLMGGLAASGYH